RGFESHPLRQFSCCPRAIRQRASDRVLAVASGRGPLAWLLDLIFDRGGARTAISELGQLFFVRACKFFDEGVWELVLRVLLQRVIELAVKVPILHLVRRTQQTAAL